MRPLLLVLLLALATARASAQTSECLDGAVTDATKTALIADCEVLLDVKATLEGTGTLNWAAATAIASWDGIYTGEVDGATRVVAMSIQADVTNLTGSLPSRLSELTGLKGLWLEGALTGTIPAELAGLPLLDMLWVHNNNLSGVIPPQFGELADRFKDGTGGSKILGLPPSFGNLKLNWNRLSGCIPSGLASFASDINPQQGSHNLPVCDADPTLSALSVTPGTLKETFDPATTAYNVGTTSDVTSITLTAPASDTDTAPAGVAVSGTAADGTALTVTQGTANWTIAGLTLGSNDIEIVVTPDTGEPRTYTVDVNTAACGNLALTSSDLRSDCETLFSLEETLRGSAGTLNWDIHRNLADWDGISVSNNRVRGVAVANRSLNGSIPAALGTLSALETLNLASNDLTGSIPEELGDLSSLTTLSLASNDLTGSIPEELGDLSSLTALSLASNDLTGSIPEELKDLTDLETLNLSSNDLTGSIPEELKDLTDLETLDLASNDLSGAIPGELGDLSSLTTLDLASNDLSGSIPGELGDLSYLTTLDLQDNDLTGAIPFSLGSSSLNAFFAHTNRLTGCIPAGLSAFTSAINPQQGNVRLPLCSTDAALSALSISPGSLNETLSAETTAYTATAPPSTTSLTLTATPRDDGAEVTSVTGTASDGITALTVTAGTGTWTVAGLTAGDNAITIVVTSENETTLTYTLTVARGHCGLAQASETGLIQDCETLASIRNSLKGAAGNLNWDVDTAISNWDGITAGTADDGTKRVQRVVVNSRNLNGSIPAALGTLGALERLTLSTNNLTGAIPAALGDLSSLERLELGANELTGPIPAALGGLSNLVHLDVGTNDLTGAIPLSLGSLSLTTFRASQNQLTGCIPPGLASFASSINPQQGSVNLAVCSTDDALGALSISPGTLNETFAAATTAYTADLSASITSVTLTASARHADAAITAVTATAGNGTTLTPTAGTGAWTVAGLTSGNNVVSFVVTSEGGTTRTYTVTLKKPPTVTAASTDSDGLSILLTMSEPVTNNSADAGDFTVTGAHRTPAVARVGVSRDGRRVQLTLSAPIDNGDGDVSLAYSASSGSIDGTAGSLPAFTNQTVTNQVAAVPTLSKTTGLTATAGDGAVTLAWDQYLPAERTAQAAVAWQYRRKIDDGAYDSFRAFPTSVTDDFDARMGTGEASWTDTGLTNGRRYTYQVRKTRNGATGDASDEAAVDLMGALSLSPLAPEVAEGSSQTFTVSTGGVAPTALTVEVSTADGTATAPADYTALASQTVTIAANTRSQTSSVAVADDDIADAGEQFSVTISESSANPLPDYMTIDAEAQTATVTVTDTDEKGIATVIAGEKTALAMVEEDGVGDTYTVALTSEPTADVTVTIGGAPADLTVSPSTLTFTPANWDQPQTVTVTAGADTDTDDDTGTLTHSAAGGDYAGVTGPGVSVTVTDNDRPPAFATDAAIANQVWVVGGLVSVSAMPEATSINAPLTYSLTPDVSAYGLTFDATARTISGTTSATLAETQFTYTATDAANRTATLTFRITIIAESTLSLSAMAINLSGGLSPVCPAMGECPSAFDSDHQGYKAATTAATSATVTFTPVTSHGNAAGGVDVYFTTTTGGATPAFGHASKIANVPQNEVRQFSHTVALELGRNSIAVGVQYFNFQEAPIHMYRIDVTRVDNVRLTVTPTTVDEEGAAVEFTVTADIPYREASTLVSTVPAPRFSYAAATFPGATAVNLTVGGEGSTVTAPEDFATVTPFTITIPANTNSATGGFTLTPVDDDIDDAGIVRVGGTTTTSGLGVLPADITMTDDETAGITVTLPEGVTSLTTTEAGGQATFTVALDTAPTEDVTVTVTSSDAGEGTAAPASLVFTPADYAAKTVTVTGADDNVDDGDQDYAIQLTASSTDTGYDDFAIDDVSVSNEDDDTASVTVTLPEGATSLTTTEAGGDATFTVALDSEPTADVTVTVTSSDASEGTAAPASLVFTPADYAAKTVTVTGVDDNVDDGNVNYAIQLTASSTDTGYDDFAIGDVSVSNSDDDTAGQTEIILTVDTDAMTAGDQTEVDEGVTAQIITVKAAWPAGSATLPSATAVAVTVGGTGDTATGGGTDYDDVDGFTVTIAAEAESGTATFALTTTDDNTIEGSETIRVAGTAAGFTVTPASITIINNAENTTLCGGVNKSTNQSLFDDCVLLLSVKAELDPNDLLNWSGDLTFGDWDGVDLEAGLASSRVQSLSLNGPGAGTKVDVSSTLDGTIPAKLADLSALKKLQLTNLGLTGAIPASLGGMPDLIDVDLSGNRLSGAIPAALGSLSSLEKLLLADNGLSGAIPAELGNLSNLSYMTLLRNDLSGAIPAALGSLSSLEVLILNSNGLSGAIPAELGNLSNLTTLYVFDNRLTGRIPPELGSLTRLTALALAYNNLIGCIPEGLEEFASIKFAINPQEDDDSMEYNLVGCAQSITLTVDTDGATSGDQTAVGEGVSAHTVTVKAAFPADKTSLGTPTSVSVTVGGTGSTATGGGTDFDDVDAFTITIGAEETSGTATFDLTTIADELVDPGETIRVAGTATGFTVTGADITITDGDTAPTSIALTVDTDGGTTGDQTALNEGVNSRTVTVTAAFPDNSPVLTTDTEVSVTVGGTGSTATGGGTDFNDVDGFTVTIDAGETSGAATFDLTTIADELVDPGETIRVAGTATNFTVTGTDITITDTNTAPTRIILTVDTDRTTSGDQTAVAEGVSERRIGIVASFPDGSTPFAANTDIEVTVGGDGSTATGGGTDYDDVTAFTMTISGTRLSGISFFLLTTKGDNVVDSGEIIRVSGVAEGFTVEHADITITDADTAPTTIMLSVDTDGTTSGDQTAVDEGATAQTVTVQAAFPDGSPTLATATEVSVTVGGGGSTATGGGTDFNDVDGFTVTIGAGETSGTETFLLTTADDNIAEGDETIEVSGTAQGFTVGAADITLADGDAAPTSIVLTVDTEPTAGEQSAVAEGVSGQLIAVGASFPDGSATLLTAITIAVTVGGGGSTATGGGTDFNDVDGFTITIAAGETWKAGSFLLTTTDDDIAEGDETIEVSGTAQGFTVAADDVTITDGEVAPTSITLTVDTDGTTPGEQTAVAEGVSDQLIAVVADFPDGSAVLATTVSIAVTVGGGGSTATDGGTDFDDVTDFTIAIPAGDLRGVGLFRLTTTDDNLAEGDETVRVAGTAEGFTISHADISITDDDTAPTSIVLTVDTDDATTGDQTAVNEGVTDQTITVRAAFPQNSATLPAATTVSVTVAGAGTNAASSSGAGKDFEPVTAFDVEIAAGRTRGTATFDLTTTDDSSDEPNETIRVSGTATDFTVNHADITLTDTDATPTVINLSVDTDDATTGDQTAVNEGVTDQTITVRAAFPQNSATLLTATNVGIFLSSGGSSPATGGGTDFDNVRGFTLTIAAGQTSGTETFDLTTTDDDIVEGDETIRVAGTVTDFMVTHADITITDADTAPTSIALTVDTDDATAGAQTAIAEGTNAQTVTVTASFPVGSPTLLAATDVAVTVGGAGSTATGSGMDFDNVDAFTLTIAAGQTSGTETFDLTTTDDDIVEGAETIRVAGTVTDFTVSHADITITDGDTATLTLTPATQDVAEGSSASFTVTLSDAVKSAVSVAWSVTHTSTEAADFTGNVSGSVSFTAGSAADATQTFSVSTADDALAEGSESFSVALGTVTSTLSSLVTANTTAVSATITDDDTAPTAITLSVNPTSVGEGDAATDVTVTAALDGDGRLTEDLSVTISLSGTATGGGTDYTATLANVTIAAGAASGEATLSITPADDSIVEGNETIVVDGAATNFTVSSATVTLSDDDTATLTLTPATQDVAEGSSASFTVTLSDAVKSAVSVAWSVTHTDTEAADFTGNVSGSVSFTAGSAADATQTFSVSTADDALAEGAESFSVALGTVTSTLSSLVTANTTAVSATITDDDDAPTAITLSVNPTSVGEGDAATDVTVTAALDGDGRLTEDLSVTISLSGTATGGGTDYTATVANVTIAAGAASGEATLSITPSTDDIVEGDETIVVDGAATNFTVSSATITLNDDDTATLTLTPATQSVDEGSAASFTVTLSDAVKSAVSVAWSVTNTDTEAADFTGSTTGSVSFAAGSAAAATQTISVTTTDDALVEGSESFSVALGTVTSTLSSLVTANTTAVSATITDDDTAPTAITLSVNPTSVGEGDAATDVTVTAALDGDGRLTEDLSVTISLSGTATGGGTDYTATIANVTIAAGAASGEATLSVTPADDDIVEGNETIKVDGAATNFTVSSATVTLSDDDTATLTLTPATQDVAEGSSASFTVTLSHQVNAAVSVAWSVTNTDTEAADFTGSTTGSVSFAANSAAGATQTFSVSTVDDALVEGAESFSVALGTVSGDLSSLVTANTTAVSATITDDDTAPTSITLSVNPTSVSESDGATEVTVTAAFPQGSAALTAQTDVSVSVAGNTASGGGVDFADVTAFTVSILAGQTSGTATFDLTPVSDAIVEGDETINVSGTLQGFTITAATITLTDDDTATLTLTPATQSVDEGNAASFTVTLSHQVKSEVSVAWAVTNTDTEAADFTGSTSGSVSFAAGSAADATQTISVATADDALAEGSESFKVALGTVTSTLSSLVTANTTAVSATINDNDAEPTAITLSVNPTSVSESDGATEITVTAAFPQGSPALPAQTDVAVSVSGNTASGGGVDFNDVTAFTVSIPGGQTSGTETFDLTPVSDAIVEGDETINVSGTAAGFTITAATVTLTDDDTATLTLTPATQSVDEGSAADFTVTLSHAVKAAVTVAWALTNTSTEAADFTGSTTGSVSFAAGSAADATQTFSVSTADDALAEGSESFGAALGAVSGDLSSLVTANKTAVSATITDNDAAPTAITLSVNPTSVSESDGATEVTVTAAFPQDSAALTTQTDVSVSVSGNTASGGGVDFNDVTAFTVSILAGQTSGTATFDLTPVSDAIVEGDETINVSGTLQGFTITAATITLTDDDTATLTLTPATQSVDEGSAASFTVTLSGEVAAAVSVAWALSHTDTEAADFTGSTSGSVSFAAGSAADATQTFSVTTENDALAEGSESFNVALGTVSGDLSSLVTANTTAVSATITDDDTAPTDITLSVNPASVGEGDTATDITVTATLDGTSRLTEDLSVTISLSGTATGGGTDYTATVANVTIDAGAASGEATLRITPVADAIVEGDETIVVDGAATNFTVSSATVTLNDDDTATLTLTPATQNVAEGSAANFTVTLSHAVKSAVSVAWALTHTDTEAADFTGNVSGSVSFAAGSAADATQTVSVATEDDALAEGSESFDVALGTVSGDLSSLVTANTTAVSATITDDDSAPTAITLSVNPASVGEDDTATDVTVTATLDGDGRLTEDLSVTISLSGTATGGGTDYTATVANVTIAAGAASGAATLRITPVADDIVEGDETIVVDGAATGLTFSSATIILTDTTVGPDQNTKAATLTITGPADAVSEGSNAEFTVTLSHQVAADVTVAWAATAGTATADDYGTASGTVTFAANSAANAQQTFSVAITDDNLSEAAESFSVALGTVTSDLSNLVTADPTAASATIAASDPITVNVSGPASVNEGAAAEYTVSLSPDGVTPSADLEVFYATADDTAVSGSDYTAASGTLTFTTAAAGSQTVRVQTTEDNVAEGAESFDFTISGASGGGGPSPILGTISVSTGITDDDGAPTGITLTLNPTSVAENGTAQQVTVTAALTGGTTRSEATTVTVLVGDGTATAPADYAIVADFTITIPAETASATGTFDITPATDSIDEGAGETVAVTGTTPAAVGLDVTGADLTITDDDAAPTGITLTLSSTSVAENGTAQTVQVTAALTGGTTRTSATAVTVTVGGGTSTATLTDDYTLTVADPFEITIPAETASATGTFSITPADDTLDEGTGETVAVTGTTTVQGLTVSAANLTITDDDAAPTGITLTLNPTNVAEDGTAQQVQVTAALTGGTTRSAATVVTVTVGGGTSTATLTDDYTLTVADPFEITIPAETASATGTVSITPADDTLDEGTGETVAVTGTTTVQGLTVSAANLTITDDDAAPTGITLTLSSTSVADALLDQRGRERHRADGAGDRGTDRRHDALGGDGGDGDRGRRCEHGDADRRLYADGGRPLRDHHPGEYGERDGFVLHHPGRRHPRRGHRRDRGGDGHDAGRSGSRRDRRRPDDHR